MIKVVAICDFCGNTLPEDDNHNTQFHITKELNTMKLYRHLCENCATKLDIFIRFVRDRDAKSIDVLEKYRRLNAERRNAIQEEIANELRPYWKD